MRELMESQKISSHQVAVAMGHAQHHAASEHERLQSEHLQIEQQTAASLAYWKHRAERASAKAQPIKPAPAGGASQTTDEAAPHDDLGQPGQSIVTTVKKVTIKNGNGPKGPWTKYGVLCDETWYGSFYLNHGAIARDAEKSGKKVSIQFKTTEKYGNEILSIIADE